MFCHDVPFAQENMAEPRKVTIFESVNRARREIFLGAASITMTALIARLDAARPAEIGHWRAGEPVEHRSLEFGLDADSAAAFIERYAATLTGWRVIVSERIIGS